MTQRWTAQVRHEGLGKYRVITGPDKSIVEEKARAQRIEWEKRYEKVLQKEQRQREVNLSKHTTRTQQEYEATLLAEKQLEADRRTVEAEDSLQATKTILGSGLKDCSINWENLKGPKPVSPIYQPYPPEPQRGNDRYQPALSQEIQPNGRPVYQSYPVEPQRSSQRYEPSIGLLDKVVPSRLEAKRKVAEAMYLLDFDAWQQKCRKIDAANEQTANEIFTKDYADWAKAVEWRKSHNEQKYSESVATLEQYTKRETALDKLKARYEQLEPAGIEDYCALVLALSQYPDNFPHDYEIQYNFETKILIVDYSLPTPEQLPRLKEVNYIKTKNAFKETFLSDSELNNIYDSVLYQICLRTLHELFSADDINMLAAISFNGWVRSINKATGQEVNDCIITVLAKADEFKVINLENVDPKACFKNLKGVGSSKLHGLVPVAPVLSISREDKRFIPPREVVEKLAEGVNLAAMNWEDFEHLIRELFKQEFKAA